MIPSAHFRTYMNSRVCGVDLAHFLGIWMGGFKELYQQTKVDRRLSVFLTTPRIFYEHPPRTSSRMDSTAAIERNHAEYSSSDAACYSSPTNSAKRSGPCVRLRISRASLKGSRPSSVTRCDGRRRGRFWCDRRGVDSLRGACRDRWEVALRGASLRCRTDVGFCLGCSRRRERLRGGTCPRVGVAGRSAGGGLANLFRTV